MSLGHSKPSIFLDQWEHQGWVKDEYGMGNRGHLGKVCCLLSFHHIIHFSVLILHNCYPYDCHSHYCFLRPTVVSVRVTIFVIFFHCLRMSSLSSLLPSTSHSRAQILGYPMKEFMMETGRSMNKEEKTGSLGQWLLDGLHD